MDYAETVDTAVGPLLVVSDSSMATVLRKSPRHDPAVEFFMRRYRSKLFPFYDVGANCGYFSLLAVQMGGPVIAIEADERNAVVLAYNLSSTDALMFPVACAANDGTISMGTMPCGRSEKAKNDTVQVPARSIRSIADETGLEPSFIKIDIEGGETDALNGIQCAEAIVEAEFSWRDHGARFQEWLNVRPVGPYRWEFLLSQTEALEGSLPTDVPGISLATATNTDQLEAIVDVLKASTEARHSRKWELCISPAWIS